MATLDQKAYAQLAALIAENGLSAVIGGISNWTLGNPNKHKSTTTTVGKKLNVNSKKGLLEQLNADHPDWDLGKGKGLSIASLKKALETNTKPVAKKRSNPYFTFLAIVREELSGQDMSPKQVIRIGSRRWQILKKYSGDNSLSTKDIIQDPELLAKVAENYASIEEDLEGMNTAPKKEKKTKKTKKTKTEKKEPEETTSIEDTEDSHEEDEAPEMSSITNSSVASMFDMSDSEEEDE